MIQVQQSIRRRHPLSDALSVMLPDDDDTLLLRACVVPGALGRAACETWLARRGDAKRELTREFVKSVLPLLCRSVETHSIDLSSSFLTVLRTAALREELRTKTYTRICHRVLSALAEERIPATLIRGAALAEAVYPDPSLRHSHNIELLSEEPYAERIAGVLVSIGFTPSAPSPGMERAELLMVHETGLPLAVRRQLFDIPFYNAAQRDVCQRAVFEEIAGERVRTLSPSDSLFLCCADIDYTRGAESYAWVIDAWFIIDSYPNLDWNLLLKTAEQTHLALPLWATLNYLAEKLGSPVPADVRRRFLQSASKSSALACELALFRARRTTRGGFRNLMRRTRNWRGRWLIIKWIALPSLAYLRWVSPLRRAWFLPVEYLYRPFRYLSGRVRLSLFSDNSA